MQPINKVFHNCQEQSQLKLRHRYNRLWENNRLYHTSCLPRDYIRGIKMVLLYMMMMNTSEGVEPIGGDFGSISPLQTPPATAFCLSVSLFLISVPPSFGDAQVTLFIVGFSSRQREARDNGWHWTLKPQKSTSGTVCLVGHTICNSLGRQGSILAIFVGMKII
jgi:hypothetical protein